MAPGSALAQSYIVSTYGRKWDSISQTCYYEWVSEGKYRQVWYDDEESYAIKFQGARDYGFAGIGMWKLPWAADAVWEAIRDYVESE